MNIQDQVNQLIDSQIAEWPTAALNYSGLDAVVERHFNFDGFEIIAQNNPGRIRSSAAKTDRAAIQERPCFLCAANRPTEQCGIDYHEKYEILINPFPIFKKHLTIVGYEHIPQRISGRLTDLLDLAHDLPDFTIFYNGPQCGASAPDHFHFQAGSKNYMPADRQTSSLLSEPSHLLKSFPATQVFAADKSYLRKLLLFRSTSKTELVNLLEAVLSRLPLAKEADEPMLNLLAFSENNEFRVLLFPREKQRPCQYFLDNENQLLMSPASVEMGGLAILPRKEDFEKITAEDLIDIYKQVSLNDAAFDQLKQEIAHEIKI